MFLWIKCLGLNDTTEMIYERAVAKNVYLLPGREFMTDSTLPCPYMRASFSLSPLQDFDRVLIILIINNFINKLICPLLKIIKAFRGLAQVIREEMAMNLQSQ